MHLPPLAQVVLHRSPKNSPSGLPLAQPWPARCDCNLTVLPQRTVFRVPPLKAVRPASTSALQEATGRQWTSGPVGLPAVARRCFPGSFARPSEARARRDAATAKGAKSGSSSRPWQWERKGGREKGQGRLATDPALGLLFFPRWRLTPCAGEANIPGH